MASKELISKEVDSLLFRMSNVFNMSQYMANSESRKFRVYFNPENGAVISQDKVSKNKELSRNYVYMDIEKNLEGKMAFLPYCIGYSAHNSKMQSTKERIDAEARIRSNLWHIFEVFENDQYQFVNRMIVERELSEITKNASFILNSNKEHINELIEETKKGIPYCNYNLVKDLFHKSGSDRIKVYVNSFTGEFSYKRISSHYIPLYLIKEWDGDITFDKEDVYNNKRLRDNLNENKKAKEGFIESINLIMENKKDI